MFIRLSWKLCKKEKRKISDGLEAAKKADDSLEEAKLAFDKEMAQAKSRGSRDP